MPPERRREQLIDAALTVILQQGYGRISIEAVAREAGVTRPVVYDHFPNLGRLLHALVTREETLSLAQLEEIIPARAQDRDTREVLTTSVRRFLELVASRPTTWRLILLPLEGTPAIVGEHVQSGRERILRRIERLVQDSLERGELPAELDVELAARAVRELGEEAGRMVLTDPARFTPERYARFVQNVTQLLWTDRRAGRTDSPNARS